MTITKYVDQITGQEFYILPKIHNNRSPITEANFSLAGLEKVTVEVTDPVAVALHYDQFALCKILKSVGLWDSIKAAIVEADKWDEFQLAPYLSEGDEDFVAMKNALIDNVPNGVQLLESCVITGA